MVMERTDRKTYRNCSKPWPMTIIASRFFCNLDLPNPQRTNFGWEPRHLNNDNFSRSNFSCHPVYNQSRHSWMDNNSPGLIGNAALPGIFHLITLHLPESENSKSCRR